MPQCQFPVFFCFCVSEMLHRKYSRNWTKPKRDVQIFTGASRTPKERWRGATGGPHHQGARPGAGPRPPMVSCWGYTKWVYQQRSPKPASQGGPSGWYGGLPTGRPSCWRDYGGTGRMSTWRIQRRAHGGLPCSTHIGLSLGLQVVSAPVPPCCPRQAPL
jgi:hypothetical protein